MAGNRGQIPVGFVQTSKVMKWNAMPRSSLDLMLAVLHSAPLAEKRAAAKGVLVHQLLIKQ